MVELGIEGVAASVWGNPNRKRALAAVATAEGVPSVDASPKSPVLTEEALIADVADEGAGVAPHSSRDLNALFVSLVRVLLSEAAGVPAPAGAEVGGSAGGLGAPNTKVAGEGVSPRALDEPAVWAGGNLEEPGVPEILVVVVLDAEAVRARSGLTTLDVASTAVSVLSLILLQGVPNRRATGKAEADCLLKGLAPSTLALALVLVSVGVTSVGVSVLLLFVAVPTVRQGADRAIAVEGCSC